MSDILDISWVPVAEVVSGYSGDPDSKGTKQVKVLNLEHCPVGTRLYSYLPLSPAATDVLAERQRQITDEGWTPEHDDESHDSGELAAAACAYALFAADELHPQSQGDGDYGRVIPDIWPFHVSWYKPDDPRRALVKAAALILAEIERIDRGAP